MDTWSGLRALVSVLAVFALTRNRWGGCELAACIVTLCVIYTAVIHTARFGDSLTENIWICRLITWSIGLCWVLLILDC